MRLRTPQASRDRRRPDDIRQLRQVPTSELDRRIQLGAAEWVELQDALVSTAGMLPPPTVAARLAAFIADVYWPAEKARVEALRRQRVFDGLGRCDRDGASWELV